MRRNLDFSFFLLSSIPSSLQLPNTFGILNESWKTFVCFGNYKKQVPKGLLCVTSALQVQRPKSKTIALQNCTWHQFADFLSKEVSSQYR